MTEIPPHDWQRPAEDYPTQYVPPVIHEPKPPASYRPPAGQRLTATMWVVGTVLVILLVAALLAGASALIGSHEIVGKAAKPVTTWSDIQDWGTQFAPVMTIVSGDMETAGAAGTDGDTDGMQKGCKVLHDDLAGIRALLPSPDVTLTQELQSFVDDEERATNICVDAVTDADWDRTTVLIKSANAHLNAAKARVLAIKAGK
jgi:hypothetical protein